jgi:hypothetical protein
MGLLGAVPGTTSTAAPAANVFEVAGARRRLAVDEPALGAYKRKTILRLCLVFAEEGVEDAVVPVSLRESSGGGGRELLGGFGQVECVWCEFGAGCVYWTWRCRR